MVRQRGAYVYSVELHHVGYGETQHTAGQQREDVFGHGQLRFHRGVCARDVCQSKIALFSDYNLFTTTASADRDLIRLRCNLFVFLFVCSFVRVRLFCRCAAQVVAASMFYGTEPYFKSGWNIMDGLLVVVSIIDLLMSLISESSPKIFGILRVSIRFTLGRCDFYLHYQAHR